MAISVVTPAHNEEQYLGKCIGSVKAAAQSAQLLDVEHIVVLNRCTDRTEEVAVSGVTTGAAISGANGLKVLSLRKEKL